MLVQVASIAAIVVLSFVGLQAFGPWRKSLTYTRVEKEAWDRQMSGRLGPWLTVTNVAGTLTSFATVFVFYLGNAQVFGMWMIVTVLTIWLGGFATVAVTKRIMRVPRIRELLSEPSQTGSVIAGLVWSSHPTSRLSAATVKWISLANISGVIWLEFAIFADVGGRLLGIETLLGRALLMFVAAASVIFFVLRYGLRGFVFADAFQTPIIVLGATCLVVGVAIALGSGEPGARLSELFALKPLLPPTTLMLFGLHVLCLNSFLALVTEPHWLRLWAFRDLEVRLQLRSTFVTALIWSVLLLAGLGAAIITQGMVGTDAIVGLIGRLSLISPVFVVAFWFAGFAALFSTADSQIYSFLIVNAYDTSIGQLNDARLAQVHGLRDALWSGLVLGVAYYTVRLAGLPFEKLVFLVIPASLNVLPGLVRIALQRESEAWLMWISSAGFGICAVLGLLQPDVEFAWTLAAGVVPIVVAAFAAFGGRPLATEASR